jgi:hypothetical protein
MATVRHYRIYYSLDPALLAAVDGRCVFARDLPQKKKSYLVCFPNRLENYMRELERPCLYEVLVSGPMKVYLDIEVDVVEREKILENPRLDAIVAEALEIRPLIVSSKEDFASLCSTVFTESDARILLLNVREMLKVFLKRVSRED